MEANSLPLVGAQAHDAERVPSLVNMSNPSQEEWNAIRETFIRLYCIDQLTLDEVMLRITHTHNFNASSTQYKKQIKKWNLRKNHTSEEKQQLGQLAVRLITFGLALPTHTASGFTIDWIQVRRYYGRHKIPKHHLPQVPSTDLRNSGLQTYVNEEASRWLLSGVEREKHHGTQLHLYKLHHVSSSTKFTEKLLHVAHEWSVWCSNGAQSLAKLPSEIIYHHRSASATVRLGDIQQATRSLQIGAIIWVDLMRKPTPILFGYLLSIWLMFQHSECSPYNKTLIDFLEQVCTQELGASNPLSELCDILRKSGMLTSGSLIDPQLFNSDILTLILTQCLEHIELHCRKLNGNVSSRPLLALVRSLTLGLGYENKPEMQLHAMMERFYKHVLRIVTGPDHHGTDLSTSIRLAHYVRRQGRHQEACGILLTAWTALQGQEDQADQHALTISLAGSLYMTGQRELADTLIEQINDIRLWDNQGYLIFRYNTWLVLPALVKLASILVKLGNFNKLSVLYARYPELPPFVCDDENEADILPRIILTEQSIGQPDMKEVWPFLRTMEESLRHKKLQEISQQQDVRLKPYMGAIAEAGGGGGRGGCGDDTNGYKY